MFGDGGGHRFLDGRGRADHDSAGVDNDHDDPDSTGDNRNAANHHADDHDADPADEHD